MGCGGGEWEEETIARCKKQKGQDLKMLFCLFVDSVSSESCRLISIKRKVFVKSSHRKFDEMFLHVGFWANWKIGKHISLKVLFSTYPRRRCQWLGLMLWGNGDWKKLVDRNTAGCIYEHRFCV